MRLTHLFPCATPLRSQILFLTLRLFKYLQSNARLAVLSSAIKAGLSDFLHVTVVFALILAGYCVVGHFAFGTQAAEWRSIESSVIAGESVQTARTAHAHAHQLSVHLPLAPLE